MRWLSKLAEGFGGLFSKEKLWILGLIVLVLGAWKGYEFSTYINIGRFPGNLIYIYNLIITIIIAIPIYLNLIYTRTLDENIAKLVVGSLSVIGFFFVAAIPNLNTGLIVAWAFNLLLLIRFVWINLKKEDKVDSFVVSQVFGVTSAFIAPWWSLIVGGTKIPFDRLQAGPTINMTVLITAAGILLISLIFMFLGSRKSKGEESEEEDEEKSSKARRFKKASVVGLITASIIALLSVDLMHTPLFWIASSFIGGLVLNVYIGRVQEEEKEKKTGGYWRRAYEELRNGKKQSKDSKDKNEKDEKESKGLLDKFEELRRSIENNKTEQTEEITKNVLAKLQAQRAPTGYPAININIGKDLVKIVDANEVTANNAVETIEDKRLFAKKSKIGKLQKRLFELGREYLDLMKSGEWGTQFTELQKSGFDKIIAELKEYDLRIANNFAYELNKRKKKIGLKDFVSMIARWSRIITNFAEKSRVKLEYNFKEVERNGKKLRVAAAKLETLAKEIDEGEKKLSPYDKKVSEYQVYMLVLLEQIRDKMKNGMNTVDKANALKHIDEIGKHLAWIIEYQKTKSNYIDGFMEKIKEMKKVIKNSDEFVTALSVEAESVDRTAAGAGLKPEKKNG